MLRIQSKHQSLALFLLLSVLLNLGTVFATDITDAWVEEFTGGCIKESTSDITSQAENKTTPMDEINDYCQFVCKCTGLRIQKNLTMHQLETFEDNDDDPVAKQIDAFTDKCIDEQIDSLSH